MFGQPRSPRSQYRRRSKGKRLALADLSPRLRDLFAAAIAGPRDAAGLLETLGLSPAAFRRTLCEARRRGLARTVTLYSTRLCGGDYECLTLVRLRLQTPDQVEAFEAWCQGEPAIACAAHICGRFDYQLISYHLDLRDADRWRRALEARPEVGQLEQRHVTTLAGHQLAGVPLIGPPPAPCPRES